MASTALTNPTTNRPRLGDLSDSFTNSSIHIPNPCVDLTTSSPYSVYLSNSNSGTPSAFETPSDHGGYSEFSYGGHDEFFGVSFDALESEGLDASLGYSDDLVIAAKKPTSDDLSAPGSDNIKDQMKFGPTSAPATMSHQSNTSRLHIPSLPNIYPSVNMVTPTEQQRSLSIPTPSNKRHGVFSQDSDSSRGSIDCVSPSVLSQMPHSPRVQITHWGSGVVRDLSADAGIDDEAYGGNRAMDYFQPDHDHPTNQGADDEDPSVIPATHRSNFHLQDCTDDADDEVQGRRGVAPNRRSSLSGAEVPNFKDRARSEEIEAKNKAVEEWNSQVGGDTDEEDATPTETRSNLIAPVQPRRRAASTGPAFGRGGFDPKFRFPDFPPPSQPSVDLEEGKDIEPVDDAASIRENRYQEGQSYFNVRAREITLRDQIIMSQSRAFYDGPSFAKMTDTKTQPDTANAAIAKYNEQAETFSIMSRSATWGTRRRSEPSLFDRESVMNGQSGSSGLIKRFSFGKEKREKKPGVFQEGFQSISNIVRKKSESKPKMKRGRESSIQTTRKESQSSLAPPTTASRQRPESPRLDTNFGPGGVGRSHSNSGSLSATSPNRNVFGGISNVIRRARSRSDIARHSEQVGLVGMMRAIGGPPAPIPNLPTEESIEVDIKPLDLSDMELDDDDEEEIVDDDDRKDLDQSPITPNFAGFHEHVHRLNPDFDDKDQYLIDRIAHQQVVRYKEMLGWRIKHAALVNDEKCPSQRLCIEMRGSPAQASTKVLANAQDKAHGNFSLEASDEDSNPEGKLAAENFPVGVPLPPITSLPAEFECQLCFKVKMFKKPSDWTKHVHEDVQPFTCTYANCREPKSFKRKADWVRHENERHRHLEWWTCEVDDCQHKCYRKDNFLQHLVREHKLTEPKQKTKAAVKKASGPEDPIWAIVRTCHHETTAKPQDEPCKFCGRRLTSWKKLTVHLAKHMEHISLPVLRLVQQQQVTSDMIISPVEPLPARQIPLTPVCMDRKEGISSISGHSGHSNFASHFAVNNNNISPSFHQGSSFSSPLYGNSPSHLPVNSFPEFVPAQNNMYSNMPGAQSLDYQLQAPVAQHTQHHGMMFNPDDGMRFDTYYANDMNTQNHRTYTPLGHSPLITQLNQPRSFSHFGGDTISPHNNNGNYGTTSSQLTPEPNFAVVQQRAQINPFQSVQGHSLTSDPDNSYIPVSGAQAMARGSYTSNGNESYSSSPNTMTGMNNGSIMASVGAFDFHGLQQGLDANMDTSFSQAAQGPAPVNRARGRSNASHSGHVGHVGRPTGSDRDAMNPDYSQMGLGNRNMSAGANEGGFDSSQQW